MTGDVQWDEDRFTIILDHTPETMYNILYDGYGIRFMRRSEV